MEGERLQLAGRGNGDFASCGEFYYACGSGGLVIESRVVGETVSVLVVGDAAICWQVKSVGHAGRSRKILSSSAAGE